MHLANKAKQTLATQVASNAQPDSVDDVPFTSGHCTSLTNLGQVALLAGQVEW